jgi:hypothetical protein
MSFAEILRDYGVGLAILITAASSIWATFKLALPRLLENYIEREKAKAAQEASDRAARRELQTELVLSERDDEKAVISQVVNLQAQLVKQNDTLITFVIKDAAEEFKKLHGELQDIEQRWLSASRELANGAAKQDLTGMNLAKLADNYKSLEERIVLLVAFGVEKQGEKH